MHCIACCCSNKKEQVQVSGTDMKLKCGLKTPCFLLAFWRDPPPRRPSIARPQHAAAFPAGAVVSIKATEMFARNRLQPSHSSRCLFESKTAACNWQTAKGVGVQSTAAAQSSFVPPPGASPADDARQLQQRQQQRHRHRRCSFVNPASQAHPAQAPECSSDSGSRRPRLSEAACARSEMPHIGRGCPQGLAQGI